MRRATVFCIGLSGFLFSSAPILNSDAAQEQKVRGSAVDFRQNREVLILYQAGQADKARQQAKDAGLEVIEDYQPGHFGSSVQKREARGFLVFCQTAFRGYHPGLTPRRSLGMASGSTPSPQQDRDRGQRDDRGRFAPRCGDHRV
jgi:hypothetical protein